MGTSSARFAPTGRFWRRAKAAASRYLSPESGGAVAAREVAARYLTALAAEGGEGTAPASALVSFRLTRRVAQNLGAFLSLAESQGWPAALAAWNLGNPAPAGLPQSRGAALAVPGAGLEQAASQSALVGLLLDLAPITASGEHVPAAAQLVPRFLAAALHGRLTLDLGESLEAAAPGFLSLRQGLRELGACLDRAATAAPATPPPLTPEHWQGLPGWTWVTQRLEGLMAQLHHQ